MDFLPGILPFYVYKTLLWLDNMGFGDPPKKRQSLKKMQFNMQAIVWSTLAHGKKLSLTLKKTFFCVNVVYCTASHGKKCSPIFFTYAPFL